MKKLLISLLLAASLLLCLTAVNAENADVPQRLEDLPILQKSQKPENFGYNYLEDDQTLTVIAENLPAGWIVNGTLYRTQDGDETDVKEEWQSADHLTWTHEKPSYLDDSYSIYAVEIYRYDESSQVSEWCVYNSDHSLLGWMLQDDTTGTTLDFTGTMYIFYADETTNIRFYYDLNGDLREKLPDPAITYQNNKVYESLDLFLDEPKVLNISVPNAETIRYTLATEEGIALAENTISGNQLSFDLAPHLKDVGTYYLYISAEKTGAMESYANVELNLKALAVVESGNCGNGVTWELNNKGVLTISGTGAMDDFSSDTMPWYEYLDSDYIEKIVIGNGVTHIGANAFRYCGLVMTVNIPSSVTSIGADAFSSCSSLDTITIPSSVTTIGSGAFSECGLLYTIHYGGTVAEWSNISIGDNNAPLLMIPKHCSDGDVSAQEATGAVGDGVTFSLTPDGLLTVRGAGSWNPSVFSLNYHITHAILEESVTHIGNSAFYYCGNLQDIHIPLSVESIGDEAFEYCRSLTDIYYAGTEEQWNSIVFVEDYELPDGITVHYNSSASAQLATPEILDVEPETSGYTGNAITGRFTIPDGAAMIHVAIGRMVDGVFDEVFNYSYYPVGDTFCLLGHSTHAPGTYQIRVTAWTHEYYSDDPEETALDSETAIYELTLEKCPIPSAPEVTLAADALDLADFSDDNVPSIGYTVAGDDTEAVAWSWDLYGTVTGEGEIYSEWPESFYTGNTGTLSLTRAPGRYEVYFWRRVNGIWSNYTMVTVTVSASESLDVPTVTYAGEAIADNAVFSGDDQLIFAASCENAQEMSFQLNHVIDGEENYIYSGWSGSGELTIDLTNENLQPGSYMLIVRAFHLEWNSNIRRIPFTIAGGGANHGTCGENVTWTYDEDSYTLTIIGTGPMDDYDSSSSEPWAGYQGLIQTVVISEGVTSIGDGVFCNCENITSVSLPDSLLSINSSAFTSCTSLSNITIPKNVSEIGIDAFCDCPSLTAFTVDNQSAHFTTQNGVLFNKDMTYLIAYPTGKSDSAYTIPSTVTSIAGDVFWGASHLTSVVIPEGISTIAEGMFWNCDNLQNVTIPVSVTTIDNYAFSGCSALTDIYYAGTEEQWNTISIGVSNDSLTSATIFYNSHPNSQLPAPVISNLITGSTIGRDVSFDYHCAKGTERVSLSVGFINDSGNIETVEGIGINDYDPNSANDTVQLGGYAFRTPGTYQIRMKAYTWSYGEEPSETIADSEETICEFTLADAELPTITVNLSVTETEFSYGDSELDNLTYSVPGADNVALAWWVYSEQTDDVNGSSLSGGYGPTDKLYADIGRNEYTFYGRVNGIWSEPVTKIITVAPAGVLDVPTISYNGTVLNETLTITSGESLVFTVECENAASFTCTVLKELEDGSVDRFADAESSDGVIDLSSYNLSPGTYYLNFGVSSDGWSSPDTERITLTITDGSTLPAPTISVAPSTRRQDLTISLTGPENAEAIDVILEAQNVTELYSNTISGISGEFTVPGWYVTDDFTYILTAVARISGEGEEDWIYGEEAVSTFTLPDPAQPEPTVPSHMTFSALEGISGEISMTVEGADAIAYTSFFEGMGGGRPDEFTEGDTVYLSAETDENGDYAYGSYEISCYARFGDLWYDIGSDWVTIIPVPTTTWSIDDNGVMTVGGTGTFTDKRWRYRYEDTITAVIINEGVTGIGEEVFAYCNSLTSVTLPDGLTYIGELAFIQSPIQTVTVPAGVPTKTETYYSIKNASSSEEVLFSVTLPATVTSARNSFWATNMPRIYPDFKVPAGLRTIDEEAFSGISASFVWLSDDTKSVGSKAFANCSKLKYVRIPEGCTSIAPDAFPKSTILLVPEYDTYASDFAKQNGYTVIRMFLGGGNG